MDTTVPRTIFRKARRAGHPWGDREAGATSPEYGLVLAAVAAALLTACLTLGQSLADEFRCLTEQLNGSTEQLAGGTAECGALPREPIDSVPPDDVTGTTDAPGATKAPGPAEAPGPAAPSSGTDSPTSSPTTDSPTTDSPTTGSPARGSSTALALATDE
ncbi:MAG: hypothetical protein QG622_1128 [Actinomycetota bacterium]|nr:hypothetical protein [Actinomycetota bacterium]